MERMHSYTAMVPFASECKLMIMFALNEEKSKGIDYSKLPFEMIS